MIINLAEKQMFLESETENNSEMEKKITGEERVAAKLRIDLQEHENTRSQLQDEVHFADAMIYLFVMQLHYLFAKLPLPRGSEVTFVVSERRTATCLSRTIQGFTLLLLFLIVK